EAEKRADAFFQDTHGLLAQLQDQIEDFIAAEDEVLAERHQQTLVQTRESFILIGSAVVFAVVLTVILALHSARGVTRPLQALREAAGQLIAGRFRTVAPSGPAEIVDLIIRFNHMAITLSERTGELKGQEERYRTYIGAV